MSGGKDDVLQTALQLERDGRKFYIDVAARTSSELVKKMFESFAEDEVRHIEWIQNLSSGGVTAGAANRELYGRLRHVFADVPENVRLSAELSEDDLKALDIAIDLEKKARIAYGKWADESDVEDVRDLCRTLEGMERFHEEVLNNTKTYLDRTADWFLQEEQWNFEGG